MEEVSRTGDVEVRREKRQQLQHQPCSYTGHASLSVNMAGVWKQSSDRAALTMGKRC